MRLGRAGSFGLLTVFCARAGLAQAPTPRSGPPSWAHDAVWYAITVDRFKNGDPRNDPKPADLRGAWPTDLLRDWQVAPWTASWYTQLPAERATGRDFYSTVPTRRYGGDLAGILERLDHFQGLGVNALLLSPVFEAPSALKRDPTFLHHVDNNFGPDPEGDRLVWATESPADPATWKWTGADRFFLRFSAGMPPAPDQGRGRDRAALRRTDLLGLPGRARPRRRLEVRGLVRRRPLRRPGHAGRRARVHGPGRRAGAPGVQEGRRRPGRGTEGAHQDRAQALERPERRR